MFIGHYGPSLAAKRFAPGVPLWVLFVAVQALDVAFALFLATGVEHMRIVPGFTAVNAYDLYDMPWSHSLAAALVWSAAAAIGWRLARGRGRGAEAAWIAGAIFSHFALDLLVHTPDLSLAGAHTARLGLGLWSSRAATIALELSSLGIGLALYEGSFTGPRAPAARMRTIPFALVLAALAVATPFLPAPTSIGMMIGQLLGGYVALALGAHFADRSARRRAAA